MKFLNSYLHLFISMFIVGICSQGLAQESIQNRYTHFQLLFKLISLNEQIDFSTLDTFRIGIPDDAGITDDLSESRDTLLFTFCEFLTKSEIQLRPVKICPIRCDSFAAESKNQLQSILFNHHCEKNMDEMLEICRENNILSFTFDSIYVTKGVSVGIFKNHSDKLMTLINWQQLKEEEWGLDAQILQFAKIHQINDE